MSTWPRGGGTDVKAFWERKILTWEQGRYEQTGGGGVLEQLADRASDSLRFRLASSAELLAPYVTGKHVVDLGCGSGLLSPALLAAGAASVHGFDISEAAIARAKARAEALGLQNARFDVGTVDALPDIPRDVVVSLGLTDWLTDAELHQLFAWSGDAAYLHAFSEDRRSLQQAIHRAYCWIAYGWRTAGYVPRYFTAAWFADLAGQHHPGPAYVWRHPRLSFGAYLTSLPVGELVVTSSAAR